MRPTTTDGLVLLYNFAVVLSGGYVSMQFQIDDRFVLLGIAFGFALFWTLYFRVSMLPRLLEQAVATEEA